MSVTTREPIGVEFAKTVEEVAQREALALLGRDGWDSVDLRITLRPCKTNDDGVPESDFSYEIHAGSRHEVGATVATIETGVVETGGSTLPE
jgi:hypothetical protein